ncbi:NUDIX hydrolase [Aquabacter sp. L1I39]|uniref:NUDIX hydrolase n=1 Tax=Aquabacter sp. L1I39 TaxID=2820278 RepID=UPI001AD95608|nr:NUDIX hydrolase [Aquabacter sp. L1I39]QTL05424.1 NUDIX hydrolase [Aquabacter sp. L1I39]
MQLRLVTSRETRRWVIPKGWPMKGIPPHKAAAREAYEEAGLLGSIASTPLGIYRYDKRLSATRSVLCDVMVFPMKVKRYLKKWPERSQRVGFWFSIETAASVVQEPELASLILEFGTLMAERHAEKRAKQEALAQAKAAEATPKQAATKTAASKKAAANPVATDSKQESEALSDDSAPVAPAKLLPVEAKAVAAKVIKDEPKTTGKVKPKSPSKAKAKAEPKAKAKATAEAAPAGQAGKTTEVNKAEADNGVGKKEPVKKAPVEKDPLKTAPEKKSQAKKAAAKKGKALPNLAAPDPEGAGAMAGESDISLPLETLVPKGKAATQGGPPAKTAAGKKAPAKKKAVARTSEDI